MRANRAEGIGGAFNEIGGEELCRLLWQHFHERMAEDPVLRGMFPKNLTAQTERLALFLSERAGGPASYTACRGKQSHLCRHGHLAIGEPELSAWLEHMEAAMDAIGLSERARRVLAAYFVKTRETLCDPYVDLYNLPLDALRSRLEADATPATHPPSGRSLLCAAVGAWDRERVELLLEFGADVLWTDSAGHDPLYRAANGAAPKAEADGCAVVELLVRSGANVRGNDGLGSMTALHMSARRGTAKVAKALLALGAEIEARDKKGEPPLRRAVNCGPGAVVRILLRHGADPLSRDQGGKTLLEAARTQEIRAALLQAAQGTNAEASPFGLSPASRPGSRGAGDGQEPRG